MHNTNKYNFKQSGQIFERGWDEKPCIDFAWPYLLNFVLLHAGTTTAVSSTTTPPGREHGKAWLGPVQHTCHVLTYLYVAVAQYHCVNSAYMSLK